MPSFSQRMGLTSASKEIQTKSMDDALRNQLWNALTIAVWNPWKEAYHQTGAKCSQFLKGLWHLHYHEPLDHIPVLFDSSNSSLPVVRQRFFASEWYEVYDFLEFVIQRIDDTKAQPLSDMCNDALDLKTQRTA